MNYIWRKLWAGRDILLKKHNAGHRLRSHTSVDEIEHHRQQESKKPSIRIPSRASVITIQPDVDEIAKSAEDEEISDLLKKSSSHSTRKHKHKHGEHKHGEHKHGEHKHGEHKHGERKHGERKHGERKRNSSIHDLPKRNDSKRDTSQYGESTQKSGDGEKPYKYVAPIEKDKKDKSERRKSIDKNNKTDTDSVKFAPYAMVEEIVPDGERPQRLRKNGKPSVVLVVLNQKPEYPICYCDEARQGLPCSCRCVDGYGSDCEDEYAGEGENENDNNFRYIGEYRRVDIPICISKKTCTHCQKLSEGKLDTIESTNTETDDCCQSLSDSDDPDYICPCEIFKSYQNMLKKIIPKHGFQECQCSGAPKRRRKKKKPEDNEHAKRHTNADEKMNKKLGKKKVPPVLLPKNSKQKKKKKEEENVKPQDDTNNKPKQTKQKKSIIKKNKAENKMQNGEIEPKKKKSVKLIVSDDDDTDETYTHDH